MALYVAFPALNADLNHLNNSNSNQIHPKCRENGAIARPATPTATDAVAVPAANGAITTTHALGLAHGHAAAGTAEHTTVATTEATATIRPTGGPRTDGMTVLTAAADGTRLLATAAA